MKKLCLLLALVLLGACIFMYIKNKKNFQITNNDNKELILKTDNEKFSYLVGVNTAASLKTIPMEINKEFLIKGLSDAMDGKKLALSEEEMAEVREKIGKELAKKQEESLNSMKTENLKKANEFLAKNKKKENIKETASGLQYEILEKKDGPKPTKENTVKVHYRGTSLDGKEFDSSYKRNEPIEFPLGGVIPGWTEGVQLMSKGEKFRFFIPPMLAYGENGVPGIEPNSLLIFEVELLDFK